MIYQFIHWALIGSWTLIVTIETKQIFKQVFYWTVKIIQKKLFNDVLIKWNQKYLIVIAK